MKINKIDLDCINHPDFDLFKTNYPVISRDLFIGKDDYDFLEEWIMNKQEAIEEIKKQSTQAYEDN